MGTTDRRGGLIPKHLDSGNLGTENNSLNEIESLNFVTEAAGRTVAGTMGRHRMRNPRLGQISVIILRGVLDYSGL